MKCKYCQAEIEKDAQFCTNCGKDLSNLPRCIKCGEILDNNTEFCPYCGTKQPEQEKPQTEKPKGKKKFWIVGVVIAILIILGCGLFYYSQTKDHNEQAETDSTAVILDDAKEETKVAESISFEDMLKVADVIFAFGETGDKDMSVLDKVGIELLYEHKVERVDEYGEENIYYGKDAKVLPSSNGIKFEPKSSHAVVINKSYTTIDIYFIDKEDYEFFTKQAMEYGLVKTKDDESNTYIIPNQKHDEGVIEKEWMDANKDSRYYYSPNGKSDNGWYSCSINEPT